MTKLTKFFSLIFLLVAITSCGQTQKPFDNGSYIVDNSIKQKVDKKVKSYNGVTMSSMDVKLYENDSVTADTYSKGKSIDECMTFTTLDGDTINITGFAGMFAGFGYQITLFKDTCIVRHYAKSDAEIYKLHKTDSLEFGVSVPCKTYKLTLSKKPTFKKGEVLEGIIELTSEDYYEVANRGETKCKIQLTGYFKTDPLESTEDKYLKTKDK
ncbi:MAG: hypothetical protein D8M52_10630 [Chlorobi bacterium]|nr:hypothetical protein [Chlorobiota bacterium]NOG68615.1 hypothetical protein [Chlorobiota bacterium]